MALTSNKFGTLRRPPDDGETLQLGGRIGLLRLVEGA